MSNNPVVQTHRKWNAISFVAPTVLSLDPWMCPIFFQSSIPFYISLPCIPQTSTQFSSTCLLYQGSLSLPQGVLPVPPTFWPPVSVSCSLTCLPFPHHSICYRMETMYWMLSLGYNLHEPRANTLFFTSFSASIRGTGSQQNSIKGFVLTGIQCSEFRAKVRDRP